MARKPETLVAAEVTKTPSPFLAAPATPAPEQMQEPRTDDTTPQPEPEPNKPPAESNGAGGRDLSELANLFNSPRKIQVGSAIPSDLYLKLSRREGGVPHFFRKALERPLDAYEVMLGAKKLGELRKTAGRTTITPKIEVEQYALVQEIIKKAVEAGVGQVTEAKVVAGIIYCEAAHEGLL